MSYDPLDLNVLKSIVSNKKNGTDFANECDTKIFSPEVWNFATLTVGYIKTYKELPTLRVITERLSKGNNEKLTETVKNIWLELDKIKVNDSEYKHDLEKIKQRFSEKKILSANSWLSKLVPGNIDINKTVIELQKTIKDIAEISSNKLYESKDIKDYLPVFVERFNSKKNNPSVDRGILTGYSFIDYCTNGLKEADYMLIAAETGFGKSLLLNNIAIQVWLQNNNINMRDGFTEGKDIIYFSLEMPYEDCFNRLLSRLSGVPSRNIENAKLSKEEFAKIKNCLDFIEKYPYQFKIVDIAEACANDLEAILTNDPVKFYAMFVDYLGIMRPNQKTEEQDWQKQSVISYELRAIARKYKISMFSAVQLNRKGAAKDSSEMIGLNRLARSAGIATHATHVIQIESRPQEEKHPDMVIHMIKNRKGPKGKGVLIKNLACASLLDKKDGVPTEDYDDFFKDQDDISEEMEDLEL